MQTHHSQSFNIQLGRKLRALRVASGLSQRELAGKMGVTFQQVQKYEQGVNKVSFEQLCHLCDMFRLPLDYWVHGQAALTRTEATPNASWMEDATIVCLVRAFQAIPSHDQRMGLCHLAKTMAVPEPACICE